MNWSPASRKSIDESSRHTRHESTSFGSAEVESDGDFDAIDVSHLYSSPSTSGVERYRSPKDAAIVMMVLPLFSGLAATRAAAQTFAPVEMPPKIPSSRAKRRAHSKACSFETSSTPLRSEVS